MRLELSFDVLEEHPMPLLTLNLLGSFDAQLDEQPLTDFVSDKARALLVYLVLEADQVHSRSHLAGLLWPENPEQRARTNLRHALANIRKLLCDRQAETPFLLVTRQTLQFNLSVPHKVDVLCLEEQLSHTEQLGQGHTDNVQALDNLANTLLHYRRPLLASFTISDAPDFEAWLLLRREQIQRKVIESLSRLVDHFENRGNFEQAIVLMRHTTELEPSHEESHQRLIGLLIQVGQRSAALTQYERCVQALREELDVAPSAQIQQLYQRITASAGHTNREATATEADLRHSTVADVPHNLPAPVTTLLGREQTISAIIKLICGDARFVTLTGTGGVGKTRLAIASGWELRANFPDGVYLVELAATQSPEIVIDAIAQTIHVQTTGSRPLLEQVQRKLRDAQILLILDNFEHLLDAAPLVTQLLTTCPRLKVLATSRERLALHGEYEFGIAPLTVPEAQNIFSLNGSDKTNVLQNPAVALFCTRAVASNHTFEATSENIDDIVKICRHLDGLPLALELAAARIKHMTPAILRHRLTENYAAPRFLQTAERDLSQRHQSVWDTIAWSYSLLTKREQRVFRRLAVFVGGFTADAAGAICQIEQAFLMNGVLDSLVNKSLLQATTIDKQGRRFSMLEMVRQFGLGELVRLEEASAINNRHAQFFSDYIEALDPENREKNDAKDIIAKIRTEYPNLCKAFTTFRLMCDADECFKLCKNLGSFWHLGWTQDSIAYLQSTLELFGNREPSADYVELQIMIGYYTLRKHSRLAARPYFERAHKLNQQLGNTASAHWIGVMYGMLAWTRFDHAGDFEGADALFQLAQENDIASGNRWAEGMTLTNRAQLHAKVGKFECAEKIFIEALNRHEEIGDPWATSLTLVNYAYLYILQKRHEEARILLTRGQAMAENIQATGLLQSYNHYGALIAIAHKEYKTAKDLLNRIIHRQRERAHDPILTETLVTHAWLSVEINYPRRALTLASAIRKIQEQRKFILCPIIERHFQEVIASARAKLPSNGADNAWAKGKHMSIDETIMLALQPYEIDQGSPVSINHSTLSQLTN